MCKRFLESIRNVFKDGKYTKMVFNDKNPISTGIPFPGYDPNTTDYIVELDNEGNVTILDDVGNCSMLLLEDLTVYELVHIMDRIENNINIYYD